jgi:DNA-directed RNA polymerase subunit RPC12/RpoP
MLRSRDGGAFDASKLMSIYSMLKIPFGIYKCPQCGEEFPFNSTSDQVVCPKCKHDLTSRILQVFESIPPSRSDGKPCTSPIYDKDFNGELCPKCNSDDYEITTCGTNHNSVLCSCGWSGCECELLPTPIIASG